MRMMSGRGAAGLAAVLLVGMQGMAQVAPGAGQPGAAGVTPTQGNGGQVSGPGVRPANGAGAGQGGGQGRPPMAAIGVPKTVVMPAAAPATNSVLRSLSLTGSS